ncbi:hypothetical protein L6164_025875 [Bauhinia variegata]|uniref:Uncharacterized protein n=1 Tax=Bauhinia variegata TaxID=167791 RepID=A0ACB9M288_BAUVA|nr:hypothetical protein L6164_025875 [Bauhinia variegata]
MNANCYDQNLQSTEGENQWHLENNPTYNIATLPSLTSFLFPTTRSHYPQPSSFFLFSSFSSHPLPLSLSPLNLTNFLSPPPTTATPEYEDNK